ncbi:MAG: lipoate--protein ligase family protein [Candidatus Omnitrophica bacterium]|nr:lipoate--protein ligase family protein [Candidatus Omnitrophota bacterium]MBU4478825.1 lipoate--protein ligase family protein [Candidatus Omnitrophota bacterium]
MAVDEAILTAYDCRITSLPTLRIYGWNPAGISLGYFQRTEDVLNRPDCGKEMIPVVRRMTGGEAIFHANEVTYSISCRTGDLALSRSVKESFKILTSFIILAYKTLGLDAFFFSDTPEQKPEKGDCFCFANREHFDISVQGRKIGGNAQKRIKQCIFQHGSIPLRIDTDMIHLLFRANAGDLKQRMISLEEALNRKVSSLECSTAMIMAFEKAFSVRLVEQGLTSWEKDCAQRLVKEKYSSRAWNYARNSAAKETVGI